MSNLDHAVKDKSHHFATADMIRAGAILLVMLAHLTGSSRITWHGKPHSFDYLGVFGVNTFFVLSAYLLSRPYLQALLNTEKTFPATRAFLKRRFLRIYPLYAAAIVLSVIAISVIRSPLPSVSDLAAHFFFLHDFSVETINGFDGPMWTMPIDAIFYLVLPGICLILGRIMRPWQRRERVIGIMTVLTLISVCCLLYRYCEARYNPIALHGVLEELVYVRNIIGFSATFAVGTGLALLRLLLEKRTLHPMIYQVGCLIALCCGIVTVRISYLNHSLPIPVEALRACFSDLSAALAVALILFACIEARFSPVIYIARLRITALIASLAYAVYLIHIPIIVTMSAVLHIPRNNIGFIELTITSLPIILIIAYIGHTTIEKPFLIIRDRLREAPLSS